ncbi:hypothetical protein MTR67_034044 [Solanum verrucosum]|uniref:Uncharacterized protein n=1 Tax=Solanum verrucosum TaxID=315347 RepID=A0AAF0U7N9_SOLVR|nr:hypothetical protein MTR67_034044 [Solanum verrucosum]
MNMDEPVPNHDDIVPFGVPVQCITFRPEYYWTGTENGGYGYFRWSDSSPENTDESSRFVSWNRFIDSENSIDRLKRKVKELEGERFFEISIESK